MDLSSSSSFHFLDDDDFHGSDDESVGLSLVERSDVDLSGKTLLQLVQSCH